MTTKKIGKIGIKETSEVLRFGLSLTRACAFSVADGKLSVLDVIYFKDVILTFSDAITDIRKVPAELADLDEAEIKELKRIAEEEFSIPVQKLETAIKAALGIALDLLKLIMDLKK